jgi:hypothetical protein
MSCDTMLKKGETIAQRAATIREKTARLSADLAAGRVRAVVGPQGAVSFAGWEDRAGVTDACAYRRIMSSGSALARAAVARAEQLAGRQVDRHAVAVGAHSHDEGATWHNHKG